MKKKKVLIFPYSNQLGTTIPSITLANLLIDNGFEVEFASKGKYSFVIKEKGFVLHDVPEISYMHYRKYLDQNRMDYYEKHLVRLMVDYEVDMINELKPDIVVGHNRPSLYISTKLTKKPFVSMTVASLTNYYDQRIYIPENHPLNKIIPLVDVNSLVPAIVPKIVYNITMKRFAKGFNEVLKEYNLSKVKSYLDLNEGDITLLIETWGLVGLKKLPSNFYFLEQDTESGFGEKPAWYSSVQKLKEGGKKIIGISMGSSSFEAYPLVLKDLVEFVLSQKDEYILVSNHCGLEKEYTNSNNIYIERFIPPLDLMNLVDIVITHGGKNTLNEAVLAKKMIIGIPEQAEQLWNIKYMEKLGVVKVLSRFELRKNNNILTHNVQRLLKDSKMRQNVEKFVQNDLINEDIYDHKATIVAALQRLSK